MPPLARNKSSSSLAGATGAGGTGKPRRNKSAASLHHQHHHSAGHHAVSFAHGQHRRNSMSGKRSSSSTSTNSAARHGPFDFGFTTIPQDQQAQADEQQPEGDGNAHDHESDSDDEHRRLEQAKRPGTARRASSNATVTAGPARAGSSSGSSEESDHHAQTDTAPQASEPPQPQQQQQSAPESSEDEAPNRMNRTLSKGKEKSEQAEVVAHSANSTSEWESAADSPLFTDKKELPSTHDAGGESNLRQALLAGMRADSQQQAADGGATGGATTDSEDSRTLADSVSQAGRSTSRSRRPSGRAAVFELQSPPHTPEAGERNAADDYFQKEPPREGDVPRDEGEAAAAQRAEDEQQTEAQTSSQVEAQESNVSDAPTETPAQPPEASTGEHAERDEAQKPTRAVKSAVDVRTLSGGGGKDSVPALLRPSYARRQGSSASLAPSIRSNKSFTSVHGLVGHPSLRRSASMVAPAVASDAMGVGEVLSPTSPTAGQNGPPSPRITATGERPSVGQRQSSHGRTSSIASLRNIAGGGHSQSSALPPTSSGAATMSRAEGREALRELGRMHASTTTAQGSKPHAGASSSALAALGSLASRGQSASTSQAEQGPSTPSTSQQRRSASSYLASLRGLTPLGGGGGDSANARPSTSAPSSAGSHLQGRYRPAAAHAATTGGSSGVSLAAQAQQQRARSRAPLISKFVDPPPTAAANASSSLPGSSRMGPARAVSDRTPVPSALSSLGRPGMPTQPQRSMMSRTQQKAYLARDAQYWSEADHPHPADGTAATAGVRSPAAGMDLPSASGHPQQPGQRAPALPSPSAVSDGEGTAVQSPPSPQGHPRKQASTGSSNSSGGADNATMQRWVHGLVREAERIEREYAAVGRCRDPLVESIARVAGNKGLDIVKLASGGALPPSQQQATPQPSSSGQVSPRATRAAAR